MDEQQEIPTKPPTARELRGLLVRKFCELAGGDAPRRFFDVICDIADFNMRYPRRKIPHPMKVIGCYTSPCECCKGEGTEIVAPGPDTTVIAERVCMRCAGSGFECVYGIGDDAEPSSLFRERFPQ